MKMTENLFLQTPPNVNSSVPNNRFTDQRNFMDMLNELRAAEFQEHQVDPTTTYRKELSEEIKEVKEKLRKLGVPFTDTDDEDETMQESAVTQINPWPNSNTQNPSNSLQQEVLNTTTKPVVDLSIRRVSTFSAEYPSVDSKKNIDEQTKKTSPFSITTDDEQKQEKAGDSVIAIAFESFPDKTLSLESCNALMLALIKLIKDSKSEDIVPSFNGHTIREGVLLIDCRNDQTKDWLTRNVAKCSPWEGTVIKTCDPNTIKRFQNLEIFVPNPVEEIPECFRLLEAMNHGIVTKNWKTLRHCRSDAGLSLVVSVPQYQFNLVESSNFLIQHGFDTIELKHLPQKLEAELGKRKGAPTMNQNIQPPKKVQHKLGPSK